MDPHLRELERARASGDAGKLLTYSANLRRLERYDTAQQILLELLAQDPTNCSLKEHYIAAKGFWPERVQDEHLGDAFIYHNVNVNGELHTIIQGNDFLERATRTWDQWRTYASRNKKGINITSAPLEAAIKLGWFSLREHPAFKEDLQHYTTVHRRNEQRWPLFGKLTYTQGENATLEDYAMNGTVQTKLIQIPTFNQNYATLAPEQAEAPLGRVTLNEQSETAMRQLFDVDPRTLVNAFQYFTVRGNNGNLREVRLWIPPAQSRQEHPEWVLVLGGIGNGDGFDINCYGNGGSRRPAVGWSPARKKVN